MLSEKGGDADHYLNNLISPNHDAYTDLPLSNMHGGTGMKFPDRIDI